jgi:hypothetical protein
MKKLILGIVVAVSTVTLSCQKNKMSSPSNEVNTSVSTSQGDENSNVLVSAKTPTIAATNAHKLFMNPSGSICFCAGSEGPCLDEIIVTPHRVALINTVVVAIQTGNQERIRSTFAANANDLSDYIATSDIEAVSNGVLTAHSGVNMEGNTNFIILKNVNNEVVVVYPFRQ